MNAIYCNMTSLDLNVLRLIYKMAIDIKIIVYMLVKLVSMHPATNTNFPENDRLILPYRI